MNNHSLTFAASIVRAAIGRYISQGQELDWDPLPDGESRHLETLISKQRDSGVVGGIWPGYFRVKYGIEIWSLVDLCRSTTLL